MEDNGVLSLALFFLIHTRILTCEDVQVLSYKNQKGRIIYSKM